MYIFYLNTEVICFLHTMNTIKIPPLSVNKVWAGRRFKTPCYKKYEQDVCLLLPKIDIPKGKLKLTVEFGFSNKASDIDNPLKPLVDIFQKVYGFNDKQVYSLSVTKRDVKKGHEYIAFTIDKYDEI